MPTPAPAPGVTPPPQVGGSADDTVNQFANSSAPRGNKPIVLEPSGSGPQTAFSNFGPNSNQSWFYKNDITPPSHGAVITRPVTDMSNDYYNWTDQQRNSFRSKLAIIDKNALIASDADIAKTWADYVQQSANYFAAGATVSPWDILQKDISTRGTGTLAGTKTQTTKDVSLTSAPDSAAIFHTAAQSLLGRKATPEEEQAFQKALNQQEQANPTTATVTTTTDEQGNATNTSRTSQGGFSQAAAQMLAEKQAQGSPDYAQYQASTTYFNALMQALSRGY